MWHYDLEKKFLNTEVYQSNIFFRINEEISMLWHLVILQPTLHIHLKKLSIKL